ncbi:MAG: hypothetical protein WCK86_10600 [Planctomycetia bacterium]
MGTRRKQGRRDPLQEKQSQSPAKTREQQNAWAVVPASGLSLQPEDQESSLAWSISDFQGDQAILELFP